MRWRSVCVVVHPGSGEGRSHGVARRLARLLRRRGSTVTIKAFGDLPSLIASAKSAGAEFSVVFCIGGDATLSAAARAAPRHRIPFVPVPNGFGNVFASVFGHSPSPRRAAQLLGRRRGPVGGRRRVRTTSCSSPTRATGSSSRSRSASKRAATAAGPQRRLLAYYGRGPRGLTTPLTPLSVEVDGAVVAEEAVLVTVANVETYGGMLLADAGGLADRRMFDVFVVPRASKLGLALRLLRLMLRLPGRWKGVRLYRGRTVVVRVTRRHETLRTIRRALPLLVPPGAVEALERRQVEVEAEVPVETRGRRRSARFAATHGQEHEQADDDPHEPGARAARS